MNAKILIHLIQIKSRIVKRMKFAWYIPGKKHRTKEVIRIILSLTRVIGIQIICLDSWVKSEPLTICILGVVRDCFLPSSIQLGTLDNPVKPERNCILGEVWIGEDSVQTCLCTLPFCNYISLDSSNKTSLGPTLKDNNFQIQARKEHIRNSAKIIVSSPAPGRAIFSYISLGYWQKLSSLSTFIVLSLKFV